MRTLLILLPAALALFSFAAEPGPARAPGAGKLFIRSGNGASISPTNIVYRQNVQVFEAEMYLECELLTVLLNASRPVTAPGGARGTTNLNAQLETIIAETNLLMMARGTTIIGDRAVYTRSNETVVVTGDLVIVESSNIVAYATNFVYNRLSNSGYAVGWTATEVQLNERLTGTNAPRPGFAPMRRRDPAAPSAGGAPK